MTVQTVASVAVVGSANLDIVVALDRVPRRGETVFGREYSEFPGGKGANQAIAAARVMRTSLIAEVGRDAAGGTLADNLMAHGVDISHLGRTAPNTGRAFITVTPDGENAIVVLALANTRLTATTVRESLDDQGPTVVLAQRESPAEAVEAAASWCVKHASRFILNASPVAPIPSGLLMSADPLIVNSEEARGILGLAPDDRTDDAKLARDLLRLAPSAVLTAGRRGVFVADGDSVTPIPAQEVTAVDTTGAGDEFAGTLAARLASGVSLIDAAFFASDAAARLVQIPRGAR
jgi:ribokinase